jgi:hypothetical protein
VATPSTAAIPMRHLFLFVAIAPYLLYHQRSLVVERTLRSRGSNVKSVEINLLDFLALALRGSLYDPVALV